VEAADNRRLSPFLKSPRNLDVRHHTTGATCNPWKNAQQRRCSPILLVSNVVMGDRSIVPASRKSTR
jgi:hypothetical protein